MPCPKSVTSAISLLAKAERPLVILGKGAAYSQADEQLREFIESAQIPFLPMSMAKGILEDTHPLSAAAARSFALANADVVMLVGARLNWLLAHGKKGWAADTQFIQLDIEPQEIDSNRPIAVPVVGDIASSMQGMLAELKQNTFTTPLVAITNGNAQPGLFGLGDYFEFVLRAGPHGRSKPFSDMYFLAAEKLNVPIGEILHVGDDLTTDVGGAIRSGMQACWIRPENGDLMQTWDSRLLPHLEISRLASLTSLI